MSHINNWFIDINEWKCGKLDDNEYRDIHYHRYKNGTECGRGIDYRPGSPNGEGNEEICNTGKLTGKGYGRGSGEGAGTLRGTGLG